MTHPFQNANVAVVDAVMGKGKTTWARQYIDGCPGQKFIVVVPTLDQAKENYIDKLNRRVFFPNDEKETSDKTLQDIFRDAVNAGHDVIITTHRMLECWTAETLEAIREKGYSLILDEVVELVSPYANITTKDYGLLLDAGKVYEEPIKDKVVRILPTEKDDYFSSTEKLKFESFMKHVRNGRMYRVNDTFFVWIGSTERFEVFDSVYILTYMFIGSLMEAWFIYGGINYRLRSVDHGELSDGTRYSKLVDYQDDGGSRFKDLIRLAETPKLNAIGKTPSALSSTWFDKRATGEDLANLQKSLRNFFLSCNVTAKEAMWVTFKEKAHKVAPKGFQTTENGIKFNMKQMDKESTEERAKKYCFVPVNCKGTNHYRHKTAVAIAANYYSFPQLRKFFTYMDIPFDEERYCLSEMIQVIWRSAIRDGKEIDLYIPSERMRNLFKAWLEGPYKFA
jgi:hypothetical protein